MKNFSYLLGACLLLSATACQLNTKKPTTEEIIKEAAKSPGANAGANKFSIDAPSGWQKYDTSLNGLKTTLLIAPAGEGQFHPNINVMSESMRGTSIESYFDQNLSVMGKYMQGFVSGEKGEKEIAGVKAKWLVYSQAPNGLNLDAVFYAVPKNGIAYIITCTAPKGDLEKYRAKFDEALNSFRFL